MAYSIEKYKHCRRYNTPGHAHFLTFTCFNGQPFLQGEKAKGWLGDSIARAGIKHNIALWGYVFMPEHVHLLVKPREHEYNIGEYLRSIKEPVTHKAMRFRETSNKSSATWEPFFDVQPNGQAHFRFWQRGGGFDRNIWTPEELQEKLNYIHNNPVKRGLCVSPSDWSWSSASYYMNGVIGVVPVESIELF